MVKEFYASWIIKAKLSAKINILPLYSGCFEKSKNLYLTVNIYKNYLDKVS